MEYSLKILNEWAESLIEYDKLNFNEAQQLYKEIVNIRDTELKNKHIQKLITGTLYIVVNFIKSSGLLYLNSSAYDIQDIISTCNEIWINKINSEKILKANNFISMFDGDYYNKLCEGLGVTKYQIFDLIGLNSDDFIDLLIDYIKLRETDVNFNYDKFLQYINSKEKYIKIFKKFYVYDIHIMSYYEKYKIYGIYKIFEAIIRSFNLDSDDFRIAKTKLSKLKYMIISNGFEYLMGDINDAIVSDVSNTYIDKCSKEGIVNIVLENKSLNTSLKEVIVERYGLIDGQYKSLVEIGKKIGVSRERVRQKEAKALRLLRNPHNARKFRELI